MFRYKTLECCVQLAALIKPLSEQTEAVSRQKAATDL